MSSTVVNDQEKKLEEVALRTAKAEIDEFHEKLALTFFQKTGIWVGTPTVSGSQMRDLARKIAKEQGLKWDQKKQ
jgi:hypothetical protein